MTSLQELPRPLVPAECNVQKMPYMPMDVDKLLNSDLFNAATDEVFRAAFTAWFCAWKQVPASSLPDDDRALARLLGYGRDVTAFQAVKPDALRGFQLCNDGRLYHPVIASYALKAWRSQQAMSRGGKRGGKASAAKRSKRGDDAPKPPSEERRKTLTKQGVNNPPSKEATSLPATNGNCNGKGKGKDPSPNTSLITNDLTSVEASASEGTRASAPDDPDKVTDFTQTHTPPQAGDILCRDGCWYRPSEIELKRWESHYPDLDVRGFLRHMALWASQPRPTKTARAKLPQSTATAPRAVTHWLRSENGRRNSHHRKSTSHHTRGSHHGIQHKDFGSGTAEVDLPASLRP